MMRQFWYPPEADFAPFGAVRPTLGVLVVETVDSGRRQEDTPGYPKAGVSPSYAFSGGEGGIA